MQETSCFDRIHDASNKSTYGKTGMPELEPEGGQGGAPPRFGRSGNPILTRGADYVITFLDLPPSQGNVESQSTQVSLFLDSVVSYFVHIKAIFGNRF